MSYNAKSIHEFNLNEEHQRNELAAAEMSNPQHMHTHQDDLNEFYCDKCYDTLNYFIRECQTLSPKLEKLRKFYSLSKTSKSSLKHKYELLEFNYEELKAQKEDFEERYNLLIKSLAKQQQLSSKLQGKPVTYRLESLESASTTFTSPLIEETSTSLSLVSKKSPINNSKYNVKLTLDMEYLTRELSNESKINLENLLKHFYIQFGRLYSNKMSTLRELTYENERNQVLLGEMDQLKQREEQKQAQIRSLEEENRSLKSNIQMVELETIMK